MRTRVTVAIAALLVAALAACNNTGSGEDNKATPKPSQPPTAATSTAPSEHLTFNKGYTWPDGLNVSVIAARVSTYYDEAPQAGYTGFRVLLYVSNEGQKPVDLHGVTLLVDGATTGGEALHRTFESGSKPLEGQLAPGTGSNFTDDWSMKTEYGKRIVVRVQRVADYSGQDFPEFTGDVEG
ncbi:hypothetical protein ACFY0A_24965 [Streptomyces sp. NPDC001698]|uniref:hypothetical protein n=1 Tax=unclassified Streptomyces TaxID=2593676 RepID=UPI00367AD815